MTAGQPRLFAVRDQMTVDDCYTPSWVFERMGITFDLDVCAPPGGVDWIPAERYYTQEDDGLASEWFGRVWMNPPFSNAKSWAERFIAHGYGVCLVPVSNGRWFGDLWRCADAVSLSDDQVVKFVKANRNDEVSSTRIRTAFVAFGEECVEAISRLGVVRKVAS